MSRLTKEDKELIQRRKFIEAALEFDEFQEKFAKRRKLTVRQMYELVRGSADIYLMEMLKRVK
jgi:hypothetical protein